MAETKTQLDSYDLPDAEIIVGMLLERTRNPHTTPPIPAELLRREVRIVPVEPMAEVIPFPARPPAAEPSHSAIKRAI